MTRQLEQTGLVGALRTFARTRGDQPALTFLQYTTGTEHTARTHTYAETDRAAATVAAQLQRRCGLGARVAVICAHDFTYPAAFLGCLYANRIAVPLPEVEARRKNDRIVSALLDAEPEVVLTNRAALDRTTEVAAAAGIPAAAICAVEDLLELPAPEWTDRTTPAAVAYLQYTSGSTGNPAGVRITHANMTANARQIAGFATYLTPGAPMVSWVPFFHDLGLITGLVVPLSIGGHAIHLSPVAFVQSPYRWLKAISDYRSAWMVGPNFSYELSARRVTDEQKATLDLSCLLGLVSGGEAVRPNTQRVFADAFAGCGLTADLDAGAYGLAEATLCVTARYDEDGRSVYHFDRAELTAGRVREREPGPDARAMSSCGVPVEDVRVAIVDPDSGTEVAADEVGEIWVQGPNVAAGYWRQPARTAEVFHGSFTDRDGEPVKGDWLRTGDIGFRHRELLFVVGRRKDLMIVNGRNHYPVDIEATIESATLPCPIGESAVFSIDRDDREQVVVVVEVRPRDVESPKLRALTEEAVRRVVSRAHGLELHDVLLTSRGAIPRTSSHKIQHSRCREKYLLGQLRRINER
ncbi:hypothetical protein A4R43_12660 [Amycolatopsis albispora]|uniref:Uncharacterized protein n=1 Tax=Amycolatopsis albispora TaxID=1804986 RepID=A0A344L5H6_9PSEU|nr:hypothetical protein A4R43_12660 [Amycolatopsis albispora]